MKILDDIDVQDKIDLLIRAGYVVRLEVRKGSRNIYHDDVEYFDYDMYVIYKGGEQIGPPYLYSSGHNKYEAVHYVFAKLANKFLIDFIAHLIDSNKISALDITD